MENNNDTKSINQRLKKLKELKNELNSYEDELLKINKEIDKPLTNNKSVKDGIFTKYYKLPLIIFGIIIGILATLYFMGTDKFLMLILITLSIPPCIIFFIYVTVRLIIDRKRIKEAVVPIFSKNFIIANFFLTQKRIKKVLFFINEDGKSFNDGTKKYIVDREKVWLDDLNRPNSYYIPNLPNPLSFNFNGLFIEYAKAIRKFSISEKIEDLIVYDYEGKPIDVSYSSENLEGLKRDKFLTEMHRDPNATKEVMKIVYGLFGIITLIIILFIIFILVKK